jgi:hypothetical protein
MSFKREQSISNMTLFTPGTIRAYNILIGDVSSEGGKKLVEIGGRDWELGWKRMNSPRDAVRVDGVIDLGPVE